MVFIFGIFAKKPYSYILSHAGFVSLFYIFNEELYPYLLFFTVSIGKFFRLLQLQVVKIFKAFFSFPLLISSTQTSELNQITEPIVMVSCS